MSRPARAQVAVALALVVASGCASAAPFDPQSPAVGLRERTGAEAHVDGVVSTDLPTGVRLDDGLTPDEAVAVALWNNAMFQVSVSDLGFARADLLEAGVLTNPVLSLLFPLGPKQFEATLKWPVEVLWERPRRVAAARLALDSAAQRLVHTGLDLVVSVRIGYADLSLALDREQLAKEAGALLARIDTLMQSRLAAGDIGELEARTARVDAARSAQEIQRAAYDVVIARERLSLLLGRPADAPALALAPPAETPAACGSTAELLREALIARPDVRAAEIGVHAAAARLGWERSRILALTAVLDANGQGREGFEVGPGIELGLPVLNHNQGTRARAAAQLQRASATYAALQQQVGLELREASAQVEQAQHALTAWRDTIAGPLERNVAEAERSFQLGDTSYLFVLENTRRVIEARVRERDLLADLQRAHARLERAVGRSCRAPSQRGRP